MAKTQKPHNGVGFAATTANRGGSYRGGQQGFSVESGGKVSNGGRLMSHAERWKEVRRALGMSYS